MKRTISKKIMPILFGVACSVVVAGTLAEEGKHSGQYVRESVEVSDLYDWVTSEPVRGAAILVRDFEQREVNVNISGEDMAPSTAYSIWVVVFNNPEYCSEPCNVDDLPGANPDADPAIEASVFLGGGFTTSASGYGVTSMRLVPGRTYRQLFGGTMDYGLLNLDQSEIHLVIRTHGPTTAGKVADQVGTVDMACLSSDPGGCANKFFSVHIPGGLE